MDIDKNDVQILATQIPKIFKETSFTLLKTYPKASFALCSLFFSYIFVPGILRFLIYTIPFIVLISAITIQTYISISKGRHAKKHDKDGKSLTKVQYAEDASNANKNYNAEDASNANESYNAEDGSNANKNYNAEDASNANESYNAEDASNANKNYNAEDASNANKSYNAEDASNANKNYNAEDASNANESYNAEDASNANKNYNAEDASNANKSYNAEDASNANKNYNAEDASNANKNYNAKHAQSVRRRRAKVIFAECSQEGTQEKEAISLTNFIYDPVDKRALIEETPKEIREVEMNVVNDLVQSSSYDVSQDFKSRFNSFMRSQSFGGTATKIEGISSENTEDDEERTTVQWTEDDQNNLADHSLSEIKRNKRLENLIARRRARKVFSFYLRRTMNMGDDDSPFHMVQSFEMPKSNPLSPRIFQRAPGSAPHVLLPVHNPFDLPYEPHEEKPNLTGDSFHQEFLGTHPKDMKFCRHESSSSGDTVSEDMMHNLHRTSLHNNHLTTQEISERRENNESTLGEKDDKNNVELDQQQDVECDDKVEITDKNILGQASKQGPNLDDNDIQNEVKTKSVIVEDCNGSLSYSSSSEENEPISRLDKEKILKSISSPNPRNINIPRGGGRIDDILLDYDSSETEKIKMTECFNYPYHNMHRTPAHSIASDLQVEVSEFGSPPRLSDGNISSPDDVRSLRDTKFEDEIPDSEDMWSSQLSGVVKNESRPREECQISEEDNIGVGFSRIKEESKIPVERVIEQDSSNPHPNFVSESKVSREGDVYNNFIEHIVHEHPNKSGPTYPHDLELENRPSHAMKLTGTSMTDHLRSTDSHNPQIPLMPPSNHTDELDFNTSSATLQAHNTNDERTIHELGKEYNKSYSHDLDEVIGLRSPEKLNVEVEHPFEAKDKTEKKLLVGVNVIHNEDTRRNVDDESPFPHNTVNHRIHCELQNSASGSKLHAPLDGEAQYFQNNSQEKSITNEEVDINISCNQGGRDLPYPSQAESEEYLKSTIVNESTSESCHPIFTREVEESSKEMVQQMDFPDSLSTEGNYILESTTNTDDEASSIAIASSEHSQQFIHPNEVRTVPELLTEHVPTASSTSSSPKSVLNPRFSGDQGFISDISDIVQMELQHSGGESSSSNSISPPAQNETPLAEDQTTYPSHDRSFERVQEASNSTVVSAEEAPSTSGSLSRYDMKTDTTDDGLKETFETSFVYTNTTNQETGLDTTSSNEEETDTKYREAQLL